MTSVAAPPVAAATARRADFTSSEATARVKRRRRAEARFRLYGVAAVVIAALFLVILIVDIVIKAMPALTQSRLRLPVTISAEAVEPGSIASGDYDKVVHDGIAAILPGVTSRAERKALDSVMSSGSADRLRRMVVADPTLIGKTIAAPVLLGSDADLYLKGLVTKTHGGPGNGIASPSATTGSISIHSTSNDFAEQLLAVKQGMLKNAARARRDGERTAISLRSVEADLKVAEDRLSAARGSSDEGRVKLLEGQAARLRADQVNLKRLEAEFRTTAEDLQKRYDNVGASEALDSILPTLLVAINGGIVKATSIRGDRIEGDVLVPLADTNDAPAGKWRQLVLETPESSRKISDRSIAYLEKLKEAGIVESVPNLAFLTSGDSREPELAGILGALTGSALTMLVTLLLSLPIGILAAIYLEEFAGKNRLTYLIEVNINNLAAVPSIVFGLLGLAVFLNFFGLPRSAPLVGGLVLALLVLPTIIIASRAALKAVPPSIREAALGIGASHQQAVFHHVLPLAMPGVLTGTIIGMAHALGETAPLLMIGMVAFIVDVPSGVTQAATVLPVQIFLWSDLPEVGFQAKTAAAIIVLLLFLFLMNGVAIWLRKRFERRW
jgi:phosphate transport system permease protein